MSKPSVSIVVPCRNEKNYISKNIDSILNQKYEGEIEVLIVDGFSDDGTRDIVKGYNTPKVRLIDNVNKFTPQAMNIGVDAAKGEIFIILGGHAYLDEDFVRLNIETLQKDSSIGCSGGQIINIYENRTGEIISKAMSSPFGVGNATFRTGGNSGFVDTVAFGAYYKTIHNEIGGFDEDLVRNQDDDYNFRIHRAGYKIYFNSEIKSNYYVRGSYSKLYKQYYQYGYWKVYVAQKHQAITTLRQLIPFIFVMGLVIGAIIVIILPFMVSAYLSALIAYIFGALFFGLKKSDSLKEGIQIALVFPILHFSYGWGYLRGIINFILLRKKPSESSKSITRN